MYLTTDVVERQREDVLDPSSGRNLLIEPDEQCLERQERLVAD